MKGTLMTRLLIILGAFLLWQAEAQAQTWPNEPTGFQVLTDWGFSSETLPSGWGSNAPLHIVSDPSAPLSASSVEQMTYQIGFSGGGGPNNIFYPLPHPREVYIGYWWKPSNPWQGHNSEVNKINFLFGSDMTWAWVMDMFGPPGGPYGYIMTNSSSVVDNTHITGAFGSGIGSRNFSPNVAGVPATLGTWHRIEQYIKMSSTTTSRDGIVRWWVDGRLLGNYTNVNTDQSPLGEFQFAPTWGGVGDVKTETDYFWYDHVHLSLPNGGAPRADLTPPTPPVGLKVN